VTAGAGGSRAADGAGPAADGAATGLAAMVAATALWGATFVLLRDVLVAIEPVVLVAFRFAAAAAILALPVALRGRLPTRDALVGGTLGGLCGALGFLLQAIGLRATSAGSSAFLTAAGSLTAGLFAWPLLGQRPGAVLLLGLAVAAAGSALLSLQHALAIGPGEAWTLSGALAFALQIVVIARFAPRADPLAFAAVQAAVIALVTVPFAGGAVAALGALHAADGWRLAYLVIAGSVIAPLLQVIAQRRLPAGRVGLLFALEPVFALAFAASFGMERFVPRWWAGAALVLIAVVWVERRAARTP